jgi:hypothetical protein
MVITFVDGLALLPKTEVVCNVGATPPTNGFRAAAGGSVLGQDHSLIMPFCTISATATNCSSLLGVFTKAALPDDNPLSTYV